MAFNFPSIIQDDWIWGNKELDDIFNHYGRSFPRLDIYEKNLEYLLEVDLPGIQQKDIVISIDNNILTIKGKKESSSDRKERNYYTQERFLGTFQRSISLPSDIQRDNIDASFKDGVLHITIPKSGNGDKKRIEIKE